MVGRATIELRLIAIYSGERSSGQASNHFSIGRFNECLVVCGSRRVNLKEVISQLLIQELSRLAGFAHLFEIDVDPVSALLLQEVIPTNQFEVLKIRGFPRPNRSDNQRDRRGVVGDFYTNNLLERSVFLARLDPARRMHDGRFWISQVHSEKAVELGAALRGDKALLERIAIAR